MARQAPQAVQDVEEVALFELPHAQARRLLAGGATAYLTVNPVEYHGPHLSLHNDRLISRGMGRELHARLAPGEPLLFAADLEIGVEPCPGPGTRHTRYPAARALVLEACRALAELGARRVVILSFHGAPLHNLALQAGVDWLASHGVRALAPFNLVLRALVDENDPWKYRDGLEPIADEQERALVAAELPHDFHAGFFETSVAMHYAPRSVDACHRALPPCAKVTPEPRLAAAALAAHALGRSGLARELEFAAAGLGWNMLRPFPGYTGRPHLANPISGAAFARHMIDLYEPVVRAVLDGRAAAPRPIMAWAGRISAGGRIGAIPRPGMNEILAAPRAAP